MADRKFTLLELHFDGATQFGPRAIGDGLPFDLLTEADASGDPDEPPVGEEDDGGGRGLIGGVIALALLVGMAFALNKLRGGDEQAEAADEPTVIVD